MKKKRDRHNITISTHGHLHELSLETLVSKEADAVATIAEWTTCGACAINAVFRARAKGIVELWRTQLLAIRREIRARMGSEVAA